jgi:hypothetical protein
MRSRPASGGAQLLWVALRADASAVERDRRVGPRHVLHDTGLPDAQPVTWAEPADRMSGSPCWGCWPPDGHGRPGVLVRDRVPALHATAWRGHVACDAEYGLALLGALHAAAAAACTVGELAVALAEAVEVLRAVSASQQISWGQVEQLRAATARAQGGFAGRVIWEHEPVGGHSGRSR